MNTRGEIQMNSKKIIVKDGSAVEMSLEEVVEAYKGMVVKFATDCEKSLCTIDGNYYEYDDYEQMGMQKIVETFKDYSHEKGVRFSTYLGQALKFKKVHIIRDFNRQKRKVDKTSISLNAIGLGGVENTERLTNEYFQKSEEYFADEPTMLEIFLKERLSEEEIAFFAMGIKKRMSKTKGAVREDLELAMNSLRKFTSFTIDNRVQLASEVGITRPTLNKRIDKTLEKVEKLAHQYIQLYL